MNQKKVLALLLTLCLIVSMTVPVFAAGSRGFSWPWTSSSEAEEEAPASTSSSGSMVLVEDETTVTEGTELRASTYVLTNDGSASSASSDVYTEVDGSTTASELAKAAEEGKTFYYLSDGVYYEVTITKSTSGFFIKRTSYTLTANNVKIATLNSTSKLSSAKITLYTKEAGVSAVNEAYAVSTMSLTEDVSVMAAGDNSREVTSNGTVLKYFPVTLYNYDTDKINNATHQVEVDENENLTQWNGIYFNTGNPAAESYTYSTSDQVSYESVTVTKSNYTNYVDGNYYYKDSDNSYIQVISLSYSGSGSSRIWIINNSINATGSSLTLYKISSSNTATTATLSYANWDYWTGFLTTSNTVSSAQTNQKGYVYSGLVKSQLENGQIKFNVPDGGIFDSSDTSTKEVYTNVGLPFVYNEATNYYTFDASQDGAYFSGTPASETNLTWSDAAQYKQAGGNAAAGYGFYPFNSSTNFAESAAQYHFGMIATVPFTMTSDGKLSSTNQEEIVFNFAGDDDVWVFIDGVLVLDIGGIHDSVDGSINFAQNTTTVSATTSGQTSGKFTYGSSGSTSGVITGKLFNDSDGTGILGQTRETFAAKDDHTLTVYYLERGKGASNCKIEFNLPMKDTVSVHKVVSSSDSEGAALDEDTLTSINNRSFGFTLYKDSTAVANATYNLYDVNGQYTSTASTDSAGHFWLKNGETAKFTGEISATDGNTYYVVEDDLGSSWADPEFSYTVNAANGYTLSNSATKGQSKSVTAIGSTEAADSVAFTCTNTMLHVNGTSLEANDDMIVIDYGLPVEIDVLANDVAIKATKSIVEGSISGASYGTATIENGKIKYQLTRQLTGVEVLTYQVQATANSGVASDNLVETANVYIIPATSMYYEENFTGLVTFSDGWSNVGTAQTDPQEPGVVGTSTDSPYGSDVAYLNDGGDSNGSSKYVDTTNSAASFSYSFTGTGTTFFARTTSNSGYMRVVIKDSSNETVYSAYRDTSYKNSEGTIGGDINVTGGILYNIPVFTYEADNYGTYTVIVTIAGGTNAQNYGKEFWLDGIRIINPLNIADANIDVANSAYATDGEANMTVVTLRQKLIGEAQINEDDSISWKEGDNFVLFTDTNGKITSAEEYQSNGPKEEVYLDNGQSVSFSLTNWDPNTNKIYLGIKAPTGSGTVSINGNAVDIKNATDCYYDISGYGDITTDEAGVKTVTFKIEATSSLISITNIKVTGNAIFSIVVPKNDDVNGPEGSETGNDENVEIIDGE